MSKKIKKIFKAFAEKMGFGRVEERFAAVEARVYDVLAERFAQLEKKLEEVSAWIEKKRAKKSENEDAAPSEAVVVETATEEQPKKRKRRSKEEIEADEKAAAEQKAAATEEQVAPVAEEVKVEEVKVEEPVKVKKTRRSKEEIEAEKLAAIITPEDIRNIEGLGDTYKEKLATIGITTLQQVADLTEADLDRIDALPLKGFKTRFNNGKWAEQASAILNALNSLG